MSKPQRTAAEQQIEALRQLKAQQAKRRPAPVPAAPQPRAEAPAPRREPGFELKEKEASAPARKAGGPSLPLSPEVWRRLRERQRGHHEFRRRRDMGDWAAELLLALPPGVPALGEAARRDLLEALREWGRVRGLP